MKKYFAVLMSAVILFCCAGCAASGEEIPELLEPVGVEIDTAIVEVGSICLTDSYEGRLVPRVESLSFSASGTLAEICVSLGDTVTKGQTLARLNTQEKQEKINEISSQIETLEIQGDIALRKIQNRIDTAQTEYEMLCASGADPVECEKKAATVSALKLEKEQKAANTQLQVSRQETELANLQKDISKSVLTAPFGGKIAYITSSKPGANVGIDHIVICLAEENAPMLQIPYIDESVLSDADAVYAQVLDAQFEAEYIPLDAEEYVSMVVNGESVYTYFSLKTESGLVQSGQYAVLFVEKLTRTDALLIPINAIMQDRWGQYVYKIVDGNRIRCDVQIGIQNETKAQVLSGLEEGDVVYVNS